MVLVSSGPQECFRVFGLCVCWVLGDYTTCYKYSAFFCRGKWHFSSENWLRHWMALVICISFDMFSRKLSLLLPSHNLFCLFPKQKARRLVPRMPAGSLRSKAAAAAVSPASPAGFSRLFFPARLTELFILCEVNRACILNAVDLLRHINTASVLFCCYLASSPWLHGADRGYKNRVLPGHLTGSISAGTNTFTSQGWTAALLNRSYTTAACHLKRSGPHEV